MTHSGWNTFRGEGAGRRGGTAAPWQHPAGHSPPPGPPLSPQCHLQAGHPGRDLSQVISPGLAGEMPLPRPLLRAHKCHQRPGAAASRKGQPRGSSPRGTSSSCRAPAAAPRAPLGLCTPLRLPLPSPPPETPPRPVPREPPGSRGLRAPFHLAASPGRLSSSGAVSSPFRRQGGRAAADPSNPAAKIGPDSESLAVSSRCLPTRAAGAIPARSRELGAVRPIPGRSRCPNAPGHSPEARTPRLTPLFPQLSPNLAGLRAELCGALGASEPGTKAPGWLFPWAAPADQGEKGKMVAFGCHTASSAGCCG